MPYEDFKPILWLAGPASDVRNVDELPVFDAFKVRLELLEGKVNLILEELQKRGI